MASPLTSHFERTPGSTLADPVSEPVNFALKPQPVQGLCRSQVDTHTSQGLGKGTF